MRTLAIALSFLGLLGCAQSNIIQLKSGQIEGTVSEKFESVAVYKGIPYAKPPLDDLRWALPQPVDSWEGVRPAIDFSAECMQTAVEEGLYTTAPASTSEDCLYLNVWTDTANADMNRPVMVWIHGGAFLIGSGSSAPYNGEVLASQGAVVVTLNYRLGIFGFFAHPALSADSEHGVSGNQGIYDQIAALEWVRDNIAEFGGDPNNVTIFGESAGSMSVCYLSATPLARGLFHKAIGQSGGCFAEHRSLTSNIDELQPFQAPEIVPIDGSGYEMSEILADILGFGGGTKEALAELRNLNELSILETLRESNVSPFWRSIFVDGYMFPDQMRVLLESGQGSKVPIMVGSTRNEGTSLFPYPEIPLEAWKASLVTDLGEDVAARLIDAYEADATISTVSASQELMSDMVFAWEMRTWARINTKRGYDSFVYVFNHAPTLPELGQSLGAFHASEIAYIFGTQTLLDDVDENSDQADSSEGLWTTEDEAVSRLMQQYWLNFAKHGNPNDEGLPEWPLFEASSDPAMELKAEATSIQNYRGKKLDLWDALMKLDPVESGTDADT